MQRSIAVGEKERFKEYSCTPHEKRVERTRSQAKRVKSKGTQPDGQVEHLGLSTGVRMGSRHERRGRRWFMSPNTGLGVGCALTRRPSSELLQLWAMSVAGSWDFRVNAP